MHKIIINTATPIFVSKLTKNSSISQNFSNLNYTMSKVTLTKSKTSITVRVTYLWNKFLTSTEKGMDLPTNFKSAIKSQLVELENKIYYFQDFVLVFHYSPSEGSEFSSHKIELYKIMSHFKLLI